MHIISYLSAYEHDSAVESHSLVPEQVNMILAALSEDV
mgnify:CR=1 FL=1